MGRRIGRLALFLALMVLAIGAQWFGCAYAVDPSEHGDESAHIVTGLMVRDWIASGFPRPAMAFAENYYLKYPRMALGHGPPIFYVVQAALPFPPSRSGLLLMMAALTALLCLRAARTRSQM